jgi:hypothetical protein
MISATCARPGGIRRTPSALAGLRFAGEVRAVPEGRVVFAGEPLLDAVRLFDDPGVPQQVGRLAVSWFTRHFMPAAGTTPPR